MGTVNDYNKGRLEFALESQKERLYSEPYDSSWLEEHGVFIHRECTIIGECVRILPGTAIGFKGFSWGFDKDQTPVEMRHKGGVVIEDYVEIGTNCNVARATLRGSNTIIEHHVKIDSGVHIAHNCRIESKTMITAGVVLGGGVTIGERSWLGINCTIMNGVIIGKNNLIGAGALIRKDTEDNAVMYGDNKFLRFRND